MLNVRLREREGVIATPPDRRAHTEALLASEAAAADSEQHDKPSSAGDLALLQRFAQGGKVLGLFLRPASARVTCSWGLPLSLDQFCVVMRLLAPINRHISGVCDYLLGMCPPCAFPTRLSVPLPVGFYVEAHLPSFSDDCAHPHAEQFAFGAKGGGLAAGGGELFDAPPEFEVRRPGWGRTSSSTTCLTRSCPVSATRTTSRTGRRASRRARPRASWATGEATIFSKGGPRRERGTN